MEIQWDARGFWRLRTRVCRCLKWRPCWSGSGNLETRVKRLANDALIFSSEARAILLTLYMAEQASSDKFLVMSDSLWCLQSIEKRQFYNPLILDIIMQVHSLLSNGHNIHWASELRRLGWCGSRCCSESWSSILPTASAIPYSDFNSVIKSYATEKWQNLWDADVSNKLRRIQPRVGPVRIYGLPRRDEFIHRWRI